MKDKKNHYYGDPVYQLIEQVKDGNQGAFDELFKLYAPLFHTLLKNATAEFNEQDIEDIKQELAVVFYHSILSYDLDQSEVRFGLYTKICMSNALITQIRKMRKQKTSLPILTEEDNRLSETLIGGDDPTEATRDQEAVDTINRKIESVLSAYELNVWQMYLAGNRAGSIAKTLGKSEKSIENAIFRIRKKLRTLFEST